MSLKDWSHSRTGRIIIVQLFLVGVSGSGTESTYATPVDRSILAALDGVTPSNVDFPGCEYIRLDKEWTEPSVQQNGKMAIIQGCMKNVPVRDQSFLGFCFAYAAAQYIDCFRAMANQDPQACATSAIHLGFLYKRLKPSQWSELSQITGGGYACDTLNILPQNTCKESASINQFYLPVVASPSNPHVTVDAASGRKFLSLDGFSSGQSSLAWIRQKNSPIIPIFDYLGDPQILRIIEEEEQKNIAPSIIDRLLEVQGIPKSSENVMTGTAMTEPFIYGIDEKFWRLKEMVRGYSSLQACQVPSVIAEAEQIRKSMICSESFQNFATGKGSSLDQIPDALTIIATLYANGSARNFVGDLMTLKCSQPQSQCPLPPGLKAGNENCTQQISRSKAPYTLDFEATSQKIEEKIRVALNSRLPVGLDYYQQILNPDFPENCHRLNSGRPVSYYWVRDRISSDYLNRFRKSIPGSIPLPYDLNQLLPQKLKDDLLFYMSNPVYNHEQLSSWLAEQILQSRKQCEVQHASLIIGRKQLVDGCYYLIRNSIGTSCLHYRSSADGSYRPGVMCEEAGENGSSGGVVWIRKSLLVPNTLAVWP